MDFDRSINFCKWSLIKEHKVLFFPHFVNNPCMDFIASYKMTISYSSNDP